MQRNGNCPNRERPQKHGGWASRKRWPSVTLARPTRRLISFLSQRSTISRKQSLYSYSVLVDYCIRQPRPNDIKGKSLAPLQKTANVNAEGQGGRKELLTTTGTPMFSHENTQSPGIPL